MRVSPQDQVRARLECCGQNCPRGGFFDGVLRFSFLKQKVVELERMGLRVQKARGLYRAINGHLTGVGNTQTVAGFAGF